MKVMKKIFSIIVLQIFVTISLAYAQRPIILGNVPIERNRNIAMMPQNINHVPEILISRDQYLLSYNKKTHLMNWAAWKIEASDLGDIRRTNKFAVDEFPIIEGNKLSLLRKGFSPRIPEGCAPATLKYLSITILNKRSLFDNFFSSFSI